jgi:hypothetical protein
MQLVKGIAVLNADASSLLPKAVTGLSHAAGSLWNKKSKSTAIIYQLLVISWQI